MDEEELIALATAAEDNNAAAKQLHDSVKRAMVALTEQQNKMTEHHQQLMQEQTEQFSQQIKLINQQNQDWFSWKTTALAILVPAVVMLGLVVSAWLYLDKQIGDIYAARSAYEKLEDYHAEFSKCQVGNGKTRPCVRVDESLGRHVSGDRAYYILHTP